MEERGREKRQLVGISKLALGVTRRRWRRREKTREKWRKLRKLGKDVEEKEKEG